MKKVVSAGLVVYNGNAYLLLHYEAGHWDFPKGHVEKGEGLRDAALRELEEETGIKDAVILEGFDERIHYMFRQKGELISKDVYFFVAKSKTRDVTLSEEHVGYEWLPYEEALDRLTFATAKDVLRRAHGFLR